MKSRTKQKEIEKNADWGAYFLIIVVFIVGVLAYNYKHLGDEWTKVLEIVGSPFALGMGFFTFEKATDMLKNNKENKE